MSPVTLNEISQLSLDGRAIARKHVQVAVDAAETVPLEALCADAPVDFPLGTELTFLLDIEPLGEEQHDIEICFATQSYGELKLSVRDHPRSARRDPDAIPRERRDDYSAAVIQQRRSFIESKSGARLEHVSRYSIDPAVTRGNIEHFTGVAQVPLGFAGPLRVHGEHARGEFYVPLATSEGTLVASYNRGMKVLHRSGGVKCAVVGDAMQRAPVFIFEDASQARRFADWVALHTDGIREAAEATDRFVRLKHVDYYLSNKFAFLRFNFTTGDAGGQNMVGKATFAACNWILQAFDDFAIQRFYLESNFATDKKASMINMMRTRGKRVTAEVVIDREALLEIMDADTEALYEHSRVASIATMLSGANNNGCHAANAITAMFLACGQDVANVAESSVGLLYTELTPEKNLYMSITLPSLIVATVGGGTGLPTQRECLQTLDCYGVGKVYKFAEIVAGTVLAGEISLAAAISSLDWVSSHEQLGRNDPGK
ncbi:MAG: hydroxymethylglutaryl-CoA reductase [Xanthomonadales bacterium]|nr:hydroxymethylglutaryl-CoA reductase [Xanthomonadales bacterium]